MKNNHRKGFFAWMPALLAAFFLFVGAGCGGGGASSTTKDPPASAGISVSSSQIVSDKVILNTAVDQPVTIRNTGSASLAVGQIANDNPLATPFSIVNDKCSGRSIAASDSCSFLVRFLPTTEGAFTDSFNIPSNALNQNSVTVGVSGNSMALRVTINQVSTGSCGSNVMELFVSVMDSLNYPVTGLGLDDFQAFENGIGQTITSVTPTLTSADLSLAMVLDYSTSLNNEITDMESASENFINILTPADEAAVFKFAQSTQLMQDFTSDKDLLTTAVNAYPAAIGSREETHLYDALWTVIENTALRPNNRVIVLISDGKDEDVNMVPDASVKTLAEVIAHAVDKKAAIFTVGLGYSNGVVMNQLAGGTGGQYFYAPSAAQLNAIYTAIRTLVSGEYSITYSSSLCDSSAQFRVVVTAPDGTGEGSR